MRNVEVEEKFEEEDEEEILDKRKERKPSKKKKEKEEEQDKKPAEKPHNRISEEDRLNEIKEVLENIGSVLDNLSKRELKLKKKINTEVKSSEAAKVDLDFVFDVLNKMSKAKFRKRVLNTSAPEIRRSKTSFVPIIKLTKRPNINKKFNRLENTIPRPKRESIVLKPPVLRLKKAPRISRIMEANKEVPEYHSSNEKILEETYNLKINQNTGVNSVSSSVPSNSSGQALDLPDIFEVFNIKPIYGKVFSRRPKVIIARESSDDVGGFSRILEIICKRIYQEIKGDIPRPMIITGSIKDSELDRIMKNPLRFRIEDSIWSILILKSEKSHEGEFNQEIEEFYEKLRDRLCETYSQDLGFLILAYVDDEIPKSPEEISKELLKRLGVSIEEISEIEEGTTERYHSAHIPDIIVCDAIDFIRKPQATDVISAIWGFVDIEKECKFIEKRYHGGSEINYQTLKFGTSFELAMKRHDRLLEKTASNEFLQSIVNPADEESWLHYAIKAFVVNYILKEKLGIDLEDILNRIRDISKISTETKDGDIVPDVLFRNGERKEAYEIETLFGTGEIPTIKIHRTIQKYQGKTSYNSVNIVVGNLTALIHLKELRKIENFYNKVHNELKIPEIKFYTLDIENNELISLKDYGNKLKNLIKG